MALCTRCGQQTETGEEFCAACGGYSPDSSPGSAYLAGAVSRGGGYTEAAGRARSSWFQPSVPDRGPQSRQDPAPPAFRRDGFRYEQSTADPDPDEFWYEQPPRQASYHDTIRHRDSAAEDADWPCAADQRYRAAEPDSSAGALPAETPPFASRTAADWTAQPQAETPFPPQTGTDWTAQPSSEVPPFLLPPAAEPAARAYAPRPFRLDQAGTAVPRPWTGEEPGLGIADPEPSWHAAPAAQLAGYPPAAFAPAEADTPQPAPAIGPLDTLAPPDMLAAPDSLAPPDTLVPPGLLRVTGAPEAGAAGPGTLPETAAWIAPADWTIAAVSGGAGIRAPLAGGPGTAADPAADLGLAATTDRVAADRADTGRAAYADDGTDRDPSAREAAGPGAASLTSPATATGLASPVMPPASGAQVPQRVRSGRWITVTAALVVVIIAAAVAALAIAHPGATRPPKPAPAARHSARPAASPSAPAPITSGLVTVAPAAAAAKHATGVIAFINRYFKAINSHDYPAYQRLFSAGLRGGLSAEAFAAGYGTTHDSAVTLTGISSSGTGQLQAAVTFTSHQQPAASPTHSSCTDWTISLYLAAQDHHYKLATPPGSYAAAYRACTS